MTRLLLSLLVVFTFVMPTNAALINNGNYFTIDQAGNASDGIDFYYVDLTFGDTSAGALITASVDFTTPTLAESFRFDDIVDAHFGVGSSPFSSPLSSGFDPGGTLTFTNMGAALDIFFTTPLPNSDFTRSIWTAPDGNKDSGSTRDIIIQDRYEHSVGNLFDYISTQQSKSLPPSSTGGWLVYDAPSGSGSTVPEPSSLVLAMLGLGFLGATAIRRRKSCSTANHHEPI